MNRRLLSLSLASLLFTATPAMAHSPDVIRPELDRTHVRPKDRVVTVVVDNDVQRAVKIYADGRQLEVVPAGARARLKVSPDIRMLEARVGTRRVGLLKVDERNAFWELKRPTDTNVLVTNPLPIPVEVTIGTRTRTVPADGSILFGGVVVGKTTLVARRTTGQVVDRDFVKLSAFDDFRWRVDRPTDGLVRVTNRWSTPVQVELNGCAVDVLQPGEARTFSVPVGQTDVHLTRMSRGGRLGALVVDTVIRVHRYEAEQVVTGPVGRSHHDSHRPVRGVR